MAQTPHRASPHNQSTLPPMRSDGPDSGFVHLHLHSEYSLLDGGNRIQRLVDRVKELGMSAVAVTDHGNLFGALEFYLAAKKAQIKPILGIEAYVAPGDRRDKRFTGVQDGGYHLVLLAENMAGWKHLLKLSSDAFLEGFYFKPRMDKATLGQWADGLIAINGHLGSSIAAHLQRYVKHSDPTGWDDAVAEAKWHAETFKPGPDGEPRFYIELQRHDVDDQQEINPSLVRLARELDLPLICDNDAHFLLDSDWDVHDTLCCVSMGKTKQDESRLRYSRDLYVKSPRQMAALFEDLPEAVENTRRVADRCNVELDLTENHAPVVQIELEPPLDDEAVPPQQRVMRCTEGGAPGSNAWFKDVCARVRLSPANRETLEAGGETIDESRLERDCDAALRLLAEAGAIWRYGPDGVTGEIRDRLERELKVLADKSISAYFLIVWDFVNEARRRGIPANARGSGVGTMVGYVLGLSNACPVRYGLLFERFTDPNRSEYPDIDIDLCQIGRGEIIEYVRQKYGHVAQIITFGTLKARAAVRDVGRVLELPLAEVDRLCKLIGDGLKTTIASALKENPDLKQLYDDSPSHRAVLDAAARLEGHARHAGVHAAGVVLATQPLDNIVPLYKPANSDQIVTQWEGVLVEKVGLLKMDFLGLRNLTIMERAKALIRDTMAPEDQLRAIHGGFGEGPAPDSPREFASDDVEQDPLDLERLTFCDQNVLDVFRRGETSATFQFESGGFRNLLLGMKPDSIEDLIAANALYRPGPMQLIPDYIDRKHGRQPVPPLHPIVEKHLGKTYGVLTYQEQVMQLMHELGGIDLREAYTIIKAISKKKFEVIDRAKPAFVAGCVEKGMTEKDAGDLFARILSFSDYGFNKSHSTGYAILAYQTAYLKTYFPVHYMAAVLTYESVSTEKVVEYVDECRRVLRPGGKRGIDVRPPDINLSQHGFNVVYEPDEPHDPNHGHIRFGLGAVKGVGERAVEAIARVREEGGPFESLFDFTERVPLDEVSRPAIEALIKCGAFDSIHGADARPALLEALDAAMQAGRRAAKDRDTGQMNIFETLGGGVSDATTTAVLAAKPEVALPRVAPWSTMQMLQVEKDVLGLYVTDHPLNQHTDALQRFRTATVADAKRMADGVEIVLGGMLNTVRVQQIKNGRSAGSNMARVTIEDETGPIEGVLFAEAFAVAAPVLKPDAIVFLVAKADRKREEPSIRIEKVVPIEDAAAQLARSLVIHVGEPEPDASTSRPPDARQLREALGRVRELLDRRRQRHNGPAADVFLEVHEPQRTLRLRLDGVRIRADAELVDHLAAVMRGQGRAELTGAGRLLDAPMASRFLYDPEADDVEKLAMSAGGDRCDSVDRY